MKCSKCGNELKEDDLFCTKCGKKVELQVEENKKEKTLNNNKDKKQSQKKWKKIVPILIIVLIIIAIGIFWFKRNDNESLQGNTSVTNTDVEKIIETYELNKVGLLKGKNIIDEKYNQNND